MRFIYFFIICLVGFLNCKDKSVSHSLYWENYFENQDKLKQKNLVLYDALFGRLVPENETELLSIGNKLYISARVKDGVTIFEKSSNFIPLEKEPNIYQLWAEYTKSKFRDEPTYKIKRRVYIKNHLYTSDDFLNWLDMYIQTLSSDNPDLVLKNTKVYSYLCNLFTCSISQKDKHSILSLKLSKSLSRKYPNFHKDLKNRLEKLKFKSNLTDGKNTYLTVYNDTNSIYIKTYKPISSLTTKTHLYVNSDVHIQFLGMKVSIFNLIYELNFHRLDNEIIASGFFPRKPSYKVKGRLFFILPPSAIDFFIPGDIDTYFNNYLDMLVGAKDTEGVKFKSITKKYSDKVEIIFTSSNEVFQKPFRPLHSKEQKKDNNSFLNDFKKQLVLDLKPD